jgi:hypothetical protein
LKIQCNAGAMGVPEFSEFSENLRKLGDHRCDAAHVEPYVGRIDPRQLRV